MTKSEMLDFLLSDFMMILVIVTICLVSIGLALTNHIEVAYVLLYVDWFALLVRSVKIDFPEHDEKDNHGQ